MTVGLELECVLLRRSKCAGSILVRHEDSSSKNCNALLDDISLHYH